MPFALIIIGLVLLVAAIRNTTSTLYSLVAGDLTGPNNFIYWMVSILIIGALGYIPKLKPFSVSFLVLVIIVLFLTKGNPNGVGGGFFSKFTAALGTTTTANPSTPNPASPNFSEQLLAPSLTPSLPNLSTIFN